ncbi:acyl-CoA synthetase (AMP-forming)/AMP-acid ligase II [Tamaricihabitans halophyticus]|uniref:Acyl-CoA synthetase (AMP-forming)/AMP-acid ligase II n=1 Tax=Tamaricihabitans halophyticus TaxID=1262583 RepID=A0A4R2R5Z8_9PSEU|nr:AMP-binding protein [Tamaricihabitans halophyticus]TCP55001.1 acyl-CoA synthetase (AMP-forming)/AMP-acid ligase II [Tamaricihabitans halophyticus]
MDPVEVLRRNAERNGDQLAVICGDWRQTYRELYARSCRLANAMRAAGIEKGERVCLLADNSAETVELVGGLALGGYVRCPLYAHDSADRHRYLLELTGAVALVVQAKYYSAIAPAVATCETVRAVIVIGEQPDAEVLNYESLLANASPEQPPVTVGPDDPHQIRFSAGTTGLPKGIMHTVAGWMAVGDETVGSVRPPLTSKDRYLAAGPLTHAANMPLWPILDAAGTVVVMPAFDPAEFLRLVETERATLTLLVATMVRMITQHDDAPARDLSSLRLVYYGASPMPESVLVRAIDVWGNIMHQLYGQSEVAPVAELLPGQHIVDGPPEQRRRLRSAGKPTTNARIRVVDEKDNELPVGEIGEIVAVAPNRMAEIWNDPDANAARVTVDGWVRTRDMGYFDEEGYLYLADRKEDMIISGGFNIWPAELENVLTAHPGVSEAVVVGAPDAKWVETPRAEVVLDQRYPGEVTEQELIELTRSKLGSVKKVTGVRFVDELPKTPVGKVLRRVVREHYREH